MTKSDIISEIVAKTGIEKVAVSEIVDNLFLVLKDNMSNGNNVYFRGFGSFILKNRARKAARNITTNTSITIEQHIVPAFKPSKTFNEDVKKKVKFQLKIVNFSAKKGTGDGGSRRGDGGHKTGESGSHKR